MPLLMDDIAEQVKRWVGRNAGRVASELVRGIMRDMRDSAELKRAVGELSDLNGEPWTFTAFTTPDAARAVAQELSNPRDGGEPVECRVHGRYVLHPTADMHRVHDVAEAMSTPSQTEQQWREGARRRAEEAGFSDPSPAAAARADAASTPDRTFIAFGAPGGDPETASWVADACAEAGIDGVEAFGSDIIMPADSIDEISRVVARESGDRDYSVHRGDDPGRQGHQGRPQGHKGRGERAATPAQVAAVERGVRSGAISREEASRFSEEMTFAAARDLLDRHPEVAGRSREGGDRVARVREAICRMGPVKGDVLAHSLKMNRDDVEDAVDELVREGFAARAADLTISPDNRDAEGLDASVIGEREADADARQAAREAEAARGQGARQGREPTEAAREL